MEKTIDNDMETGEVRGLRNLSLVTIRILGL